MHLCIILFRFVMFRLCIEIIFYIGGLEFGFINTKQFKMTVPNSQQDTPISLEERSHSDSSAASGWDSGFQTCSHLRWEWGRGWELRQ